MNEFQPILRCISNRLPISAVEQEGGGLRFSPSAGGLVTALNPVFRSGKGTWIGWPGTSSHSEDEVRHALAAHSIESGIELCPVFLSPRDVGDFYSGFSNQIVWPLFHDLQSRCNFDPSFWSAYQRVVAEFCAVARSVGAPNDVYWVHDYHLMGLGKALREAGHIAPISFFLHTPFPSPDIFRKLPWREEVMESLLAYRLLGLQTSRDVKNFLDCLQSLLRVEVSARGNRWLVKSSHNETIVGAFPISIDFQEFDDLARLDSVQERAETIRRDMNVPHLVLSVDRLDYTKGIPERMRSFRRFLEQYPQHHKQVALLQVVVPSREEVPEYQTLRAEVERAVSQINGAFGEPGWVPVQHLFRSINREELIAMYLASDVALVTPLKDGMNLVAKEYCTANYRENGVLILSEFAGAAEELGPYSFLVNPNDFEGVARAIADALALDLPARAERIRAARKLIQEHDVFFWAKNFLAEAGLQDVVGKPGAFTGFWERMRRLASIFDM